MLRVRRNAMSLSSPFAEYFLSFALSVEKKKINWLDSRSGIYCFFETLMTIIFMLLFLCEVVLISYWNFSIRCIETLKFKFNCLKYACVTLRRNSFSEISARINILYASYRACIAFYSWHFAKKKVIDLNCYINILTLQARRAHSRRL